MGQNKTLHQVGQIFGLGPHEVNPFFLPANRLTDVILARSVVAVTESCVDDAIVNLNQLLFPTEVFLLSQLKQGHKTPGSGRTRVHVFDLKRRFRFLGIQVSECALQLNRRITGHDLSASLGPISLFEIPENIGATNRGTESAVTQQVVNDPLPADAVIQTGGVVHLGFK